MYLKDLVKEEKRPEPTPRAAQDPRWQVVRSRLLGGERILMVFEKKHLKEAKNEHPDKVIYFPPEIDELQRHEGTAGFPQFLKSVHLVKKIFRGWIVPSISEKGGDGRGTATCRKRTG